MERKAQTVLITGTSSGFGMLTARTLLKNGFTVMATMRSAGKKNAEPARKLKAFAKGKAGTLHIFSMDVSDDGSVRRGVKKALDVVGSIDIVVNNAGIGCGGLAEAFTVDQLHRILDVNLYGIQRVNRAVLPGMRRAASGLLIHVSSIMGRVVIPFAGPYTASKFAVEGLVESYRYELAGTGVEVVLVEPGGFPTGVMSRMVAPLDQERVRSYGKLKEGPERLWRGVLETMKSEQAPDPQGVADAILGLIQTPPGKRPLRTVVDPMGAGQGPTRLNQESERIQREMLTAFGMPELLKLKIR